MQAKTRYNSMVFHALGNFFKCLPHFFVMLGCVFLGLVSGVYFLVGEVVKQYAYLEAEVVALVETLPGDWSEVTGELYRLAGFLFTKARELDWHDPFGAIDVMLRSDWLLNGVMEFLNSLGAGQADLVSGVQSLVSVALFSLMSDFVIFCLFLVLFAVIGYFVTGYFVRKSTVRRRLWHKIFVTVFDAICSLTFLASVGWALTTLQAGAVLTTVAGGFLLGCIELLEAYFMHGRKKIPFKTVFNWRNCLAVYLSQLAVFGMGLLIVSALALLFNVAIAFAVGVSVMLIAVLVNGVSAESYVAGLAAHAEKSRGFLPPECTVVHT